MRNHVYRFLAVLWIMAVASLGLAQSQTTTPGVKDGQILIGSCAALDGPARFLGLQTVTGATAYLNRINAQGGVHGRKIQLLAFDDGYEPDKAETCFKRLMAENIFAAGFFVGTPTAARYVPLAQKNNVPVVGLFTGAQLLYEPLKHEVINVRASYYDETREAINNLWGVLGIRKIGVIRQDDAFGAAVLDGVKLAMNKYHAAPVALGTFARNTMDVDSGIAAVRAANPEAVMLVGPYAPVAEIIKKAHASGWRPLFLTVSFVGTEKFITEAGVDAEGTIITQVVPPYSRVDLPTIALYLETLKKYYPGQEPTFVSLEGFVDAMVLVEGLKRAGKNPTREGFIAAVESIHNQDVGLGIKLVLNYGPARHKGFEGVYTTVVRNGKPVILDRWETVMVPKTASLIHGPTLARR